MSNSSIWPIDRILSSTIVTYSYADACRKIFNTIKTRGHSSLEKYTSHFIRKGYERYDLWEVSWRLNRTVTYWPPNSSGYSSISFPFSWAVHPGVWGPSLCWDMVLIPASSLQLVWTSCRRGYIIIWRPPTSCERHICTQFNLSTVKVILWSPDIFDCMHLLITLMHFSSDSPAGSEVNMLHYHSGPEGTWEQWWSRSTSLSPKLKYYWCLIIWLFNFIFMILIGGGLQRYSQCILLTPPLPARQSMRLLYYCWTKSLFCIH